MQMIEHVDYDFMLDFINSAKYRLVYASPGLNTMISNVLIEKWKDLDENEMKIILDVDPEIYRMGYGEIEALKQLDDTAKSIGGNRLVCHEPGIRIGLIVADKRLLVYAPIPLLVEGGISINNKINGIIFDSIPDWLCNELGFGKTKEVGQTIGLNKVSITKINQVLTDINKNPPPKFDITRIVRVFNTRFEFVELEVHGCNLSKRHIQIPSELLGLANNDNLSERLRSTFQLINKHALFNGTEISENDIFSLRKEIEHTYLTNISGYGKVILRENKEEFTKKVKELQDMATKFKDIIQNKLKDTIDENIETLNKRFLPSVLKNRPTNWTRQLGPNPSDTEVEEKLKYELNKAFRTPEYYLKDIYVKIVFKNVSYESLLDERFIACVHKAFPHIKIFHEEFDAAKEALPS